MQLLDIDLDTGSPLDDVEKYLLSIIIRVLKTPFESRIFNPGFGSSIGALLQEPINSVVYRVSTRGLIIAAIERSIPNAVATTSVTVNSNGNGTATVKINVKVMYQNHSYDFMIDGDKVIN